MADKRRDTKGRIIPMFQDVKKHFWKRSARKRILIGNPLLLTVIPDSSFWMRTVRCTRRRGSSIKPKSSLLIIIRRLCARRRKRESHAWSRRSAHTFFVIPFAHGCVRSRQIPRLSRKSWDTKISVLRWMSTMKQPLMRRSQASKQRRGLFIWAKTAYTNYEKIHDLANPKLIAAQRFPDLRGVRFFQKPPFVLHQNHRFSAMSTILHQMLHQLTEKI